MGLNQVSHLSEWERERDESFYNKNQVQVYLEKSRIFNLKIILNREICSQGTKSFAY